MKPIRMPFKTDTLDLRSINLLLEELVGRVNKLSEMADELMSDLDFRRRGRG